MIRRCPEISLPASACNGIQQTTHDGRPPHGAFFTSDGGAIRVPELLP